MSLPQATKFGIRKRNLIHNPLFDGGEGSSGNLSPSWSKSSSIYEPYSAHLETRALSVGGDNKEVALGPSPPYKVPTERRPHETSQP